MANAFYTLFAVRRFFVVLPLFRCCLRIVYSGLKGVMGTSNSGGRKKEEKTNTRAEHLTADWTQPGWKRIPASGIVLRGCEASVQDPAQNHRWGEGFERNTRTLGMRLRADATSPKTKKGTSPREHETCSGYTEGNTEEKKLRIVNRTALQ